MKQAQDGCVLALQVQGLAVSTAGQRRGLHRGRPTSATKASKTGKAHVSLAVPNERRVPDGGVAYTLCRREQPWGIRPT